MEGGVEVSLGGWCVGGSGEGRTGLVPFLNFWIPCCQMFAGKHVPTSMVKVYMSCVVSTPQTPALNSSDQL